MAIGLVAIWAQSSIETQVSSATSDLGELVRQQSEIQARAATSTIEEVLISRIDDILEEELAISTLLPLVVGEAIDIDDEQVRSDEAVDLVLDALEGVGPAIANLDNFAKELSLRRLQRILPGMPKGRVPDIMGETQRFGQVLVQS